MRITFILSSLWLSGGVRVVVEYASRLARRGYQVAIVAPGGTLDPAMLAELDPAVRVIASRAGRSEGRGGVLSSLQLTWSLARAVPPSDVIVSTHTPTTPAALLAKTWQRQSALVWLYQDYPEMFLGRPVEAWLLRHALRWHDRALVVGERARTEIGGDASKVVVVGEGLSQAEHFRPLPESERLVARREARHLLFLGDMRPRKGLGDFLAAAALVRARVPEIRLWIVSKEICQIESEVPFEYIHRPERAALARRYGLADVFVSASWWESFGVPPLEAMACGAPVVTTDSRGVREYAVAGENCLMVPPERPGELADAIVRVLADPALERRLRANGPPTAARFTWEAATNRFEAALADLLQLHAV